MTKEEIDGLHEGCYKALWCDRRIMYEQKCERKEREIVVDLFNETFLLINLSKRRPLCLKVHNS